MSSHYTPYYVAFCQCFEELADLEEDCPACSQDNRQTLEHLKSLDQIENLDQQFFRCVENAPDPFTAVADFFAKGLNFVFGMFMCSYSVFYYNCYWLVRACLINVCCLTCKRAAANLLINSI